MGQTRVFEIVTNERIAAALRRADGKISRAARMMGWSEGLIRERIKKDPALATLIAELRKQ